MKIVSESIPDLISLSELLSSTKYKIIIAYYGRNVLLLSKMQSKGQSQYIFGAIDDFTIPPEFERYISLRVALTHIIKQRYRIRAFENIDQLFTWWLNYNPSLIYE